MGGKGNRGVADDVLRVPGAIGYVEFAYVLQHKMTYGLVQNRAGKFVAAGGGEFQGGDGGRRLGEAQDFYVLLNDAPGADAYPIVATSFVLMHKKPKNATHVRDILGFFKWTLGHGQAQATSLGYVPLPPHLVQQIENYWQTSVRSD